MGGDLFVNGCLLIIHLTPDNAAKQLEEVMVRICTSSCLAELMMIGQAHGHACQHRESVDR